MLMFLWLTPSIKVKHVSCFCGGGSGCGVRGGMWGFGWQLGTFDVSARVLFMVEIRYEYVHKYAHVRADGGGHFVS